MSAAELYDRDFYQWTVRNAELLRSDRPAEADLRHIADEIEDMGKRERREVVSRLGLLISHLLKWQNQPERRSSSLMATIRLQRMEIKKLLKAMPSLRGFLVENLDEAYLSGVLAAVAETNLPQESFPPSRIFDLESLLDEDYLP